MTPSAIHSFLVARESLSRALLLSAFTGKLPVNTHSLAEGVARNERGVKVGKGEGHISGYNPSMEPISRRTMLRGAGVTMALPLLEAMLPGEGEAAPGKTSPTRLAVLYMPNGVNPHHWTPKETGPDYALTELLAPLARVKGEVNVLTELMNHGSIEGDGHYYKVAPLLTGTTITKTTGKDLRCGGVSLDQVIAQRLGHLTPLPSLELAVDPPTTYIDTNVGLTALYGRTSPGPRPPPP